MAVNKQHVVDVIRVMVKTLAVQHGVLPMA